MRFATRLTSIASAMLVAACGDAGTSPPVDGAPAAASTGPSGEPGPAAGPASSANVARTAPTTTDGTVASYAAASNAFGFDLHRSLARGAANVVSSPASVADVLTMVWGGARGATAEEIGKALHLESSHPETGRDLLLASMGRRAAELQRAQRPTMASITRLYVEQSLRLDPGYVAFARDAYARPPERMDFVGASDAARRRINHDVEDVTKGNIRDLLPERSVTPSTRLVVANAMYFDGRWAIPFGERRTRPKAFWVDGEREVPAPTMSRTGSMGFAEVDGARIVELDYEHATTSMLLVLPNTRDGLAALESSLDVATYDRWVHGLVETEVDLSLPRFAIAPPATALRAHLERLGVRRSFVAGQADFTGIARADEGDALVLGEVFHRATIDVDEKGTVASAATVGVMFAVSKRPEPRTVRFDHPFLFLLRHKASGAVLFIGRVTDPTAVTKAPTAAPDGLVRVRYVPDDDVDALDYWRDEWWVQRPWPWGNVWTVDPSRGAIDHTRGYRAQIEALAKTRPQPID